MADEQLLVRAEEQRSRGNISEALRLLDLAERTGCDPDSCAAGRWTCHMLAGNFELGWRESDAIARRGKPDSHRFWDGQPTRGRSVLIRCLHGLGDTIQFIRYAPLIRREARMLAIEAQPVLKALIQESNLADQVITWGETEPHWDQQIEVVELPRIFRTTVELIPRNVPYLDMPTAAPISEFDGSRVLRVGIVWAASGYNPARCIPLQEMAAWFKISGISFFSLQAGPEMAQLEPWAERIPSLYEKSGCIAAMAKHLKKLDLVITVDTMMAHLAGAMGRLVWTLLPFESDWRWMLDREDSPWYPSMRLFRQGQPGNWDTVVRNIQRELTALIAPGKQRQARRVPGKHAPLAEIPAREVRKKK